MALSVEVGSRRRPGRNDGANLEFRYSKIREIRSPDMGRRDIGD
jgi:hypothetical protein